LKPFIPSLPGMNPDVPEFKPSLLAAAPFVPSNMVAEKK
jgi:hypothetical protein